MYRATDAKYSPLPEKGTPVNGTPDWGARRWLAAFGISVCAISLVLTGHVRSLAFEEAQVQSQRVAQADAAAAEFASWQQSRDSATVDGENDSAGLTFTRVSANLSSVDVSDLVAYDFTELEVARIQTLERQCLADAIYYESRNETMMGKLGVADVVLNRVKSPLYPDTVCGVVYQGSERVTGCQFSFTCDGSKERRLNASLYGEIDDLAGVIMAGMHMPVSRDATHYHADYVSPYWAPSLTPTAQIGAHKFYRFPNKKTTTIVSAAQ